MKSSGFSVVDQTRLGTLESFCQKAQRLEWGEKRCGGLKHLDMADYCSRTSDGLLSDGTRRDHGSLIREGRRNSQIDWTWWQVVWG